MTFIIIAAAILILTVLLVLIVWKIRSRRFHPNADKQQQQMDLNADLEETGFAYEIKGDYFYSLRDCWQREVGYCRLYDEAAPAFNMIMDCEPITFFYRRKRWLIELWKGQYGITTGGEIGIYNTELNNIDSEKFKGVFYENITNDEQLNLSFVLRRNGRVILRRRDLNWWLTGFKLGEFSEPAALVMDAKIIFPNRGMRNAFVYALQEIGYRRREYSVMRNAVTVHYTKPHSPQPETRNPVSDKLVQHTNESNCRLYEFSTGKYRDTLDKLEYVKAMMPELYHVFIKSLYARGIYDAFEWIKDWLNDRHPNPGPCPYPPCPPEPPSPPCPPKPPCPPRRSCASGMPCFARRSCVTRPSCSERPSCSPKPSCSPTSSNNCCQRRFWDCGSRSGHSCRQENYDRRGEQAGGYHEEFIEDGMYCNGKSENAACAHKESYNNKSEW